MTPDYIVVARQLRAQEQRRQLIRRRQLIILAVFGIGALFFALIG